MANFCNLHSVRVDLAGEIRLAVNKFANENGLEKEFACQILILKALRSENRLEKEIYEFYISRYSKPITVNTPFKMASDWSSKPHSLEEVKKKQKLDEMTRFFVAVLNGEWQRHESREWRLKTLETAKKWKDDIPEAQKVLDLGAYLNDN